MSDLRKAAEMAMDALGETFDYLPAKTRVEQEVDEAITALRLALAQPEQEPECVAVIGNWGKVEWRDCVFPQLGDRLYTAPPKREWVGLTDGEIETFKQSCHLGGVGYDTFIKRFALGIEAKLKEKNT